MTDYQSPWRFLSVKSFAEDLAPMETAGLPDIGVTSAANCAISVDCRRDVRVKEEILGSFTMSGAVRDLYGEE